jgi:hypothetical protein
MSDPRTTQFVAQVPSLLAELERRASNLFGVTLSPSLLSLPALEQIADFLWQMRDRFQEEDRRINILLLGTYLGEMIRRAADGEWQVDPDLDLPLVVLADGQRFDPMGAVQQRLDAGGPPLTGTGEDELQP